MKLRAATGRVNIIAWGTRRNNHIMRKLIKRIFGLGLHRKKQIHSDAMFNQVSSSSATSLIRGGLCQSFKISVRWSWEGSIWKVDWNTKIRDRLDGIRMGDKRGPNRGSFVYHCALHWIEESATISRLCQELPMFIYLANVKHIAWRITFLKLNRDTVDFRQLEPSLTRTSR